MSSASRRAEAQDPSTSSERLAQLAAKHRDLWPLIAAHPSADEEVLGWLAQRGDDDLRAVIAARGSEAADETVVEEDAADETPAEEPAVEEEPVVDETPAEETLVEEAVAEEAVEPEATDEPVEEPADEVDTADEESAADETDPVEPDTDEDELPRDETEPASWLHEIGMTQKGEVEEKKGSAGKILVGLLLVAALIVGVVLLATSGDDDDEDTTANPTPTATTADPTEDTEEPSPSPTPSAALTPADFCTTGQEVAAAQNELFQRAESEDAVDLQSLSGELAAISSDFESLAEVAPAEVKEDVTIIATFLTAVANRPANDSTIPDTTGLIEASENLKSFFEASCSA